MARHSYSITLKISRSGNLKFCINTVTRNLAFFFHCICTNWNLAETYNTEAQKWHKRICLIKANWFHVKPTTSKLNPKIDQTNYPEATANQILDVDY